MDQMTDNSRLHFTCILQEFVEICGKWPGKCSFKRFAQIVENGLRNYLRENCLKKLFEGWQMVLKLFEGKWSKETI